MKVAKLIGLDGEGLPELAGTARVQDGRVVGDTDEVNRLLAKGFHWNGREYDVADGEAMLDVLPLVFNGSYLRFVVEDEPDAAPPTPAGADMFAASGEPQRQVRPFHHPPITPLMRELAEQDRRTPKT